MDKLLEKYTTDWKFIVDDKNEGCISKNNVPIQFYPMNELMLRVNAP